MFQCHYDEDRREWIVTLDGYEIIAFSNKTAAMIYCQQENNAAKNQTVEDN